MSLGFLPAGWSLSPPPHHLPLVLYPAAESSGIRLRFRRPLPFAPPCPTLHLSLCHPPTFSSLWTGGADARPSWRDRMAGPVLTLGLLATVAICGKTGHHPTLRSLRMPPGSPTAWSSALLLHGAPSPSLRPASTPLPVLPGGPRQPGPHFGEWFDLPAQPSPMAQQDLREPSFLGPGPGPIPVPVPHQAAGA